MATPMMAEPVIIDADGMPVKQNAEFKRDFNQQLAIQKRAYFADLDSQEDMGMEAGTMNVYPSATTNADKAVICKGACVDRLVKQAQMA